MKEQTPEREAKTLEIGASDPLVGQMLDGRFLIVKDLTEQGGDAGGIGVVYLAQDFNLMGKQVVIKILQKAALKNEDIVRKFKHEKEALIRLEHPNIVRILDSGSLKDGNLFLVMEYIEGYSLRRRLEEKKRLPFDECISLIDSVTSALAAAHAKRVLHRDVKPENIMLTPRAEGFDHVRLIDFGIARVEDAKLAPVTITPSGIGTILYIAPEQLAAKMEQTPAVDIYSFAVVAYEMLTGRLPFNPQSYVEMFELQKQGVQVRPSQLVPEISNEAENLILRALSFEPSARPQDIRKFGKELCAALSRRSFAPLDTVETLQISPRAAVTQPAPTQASPQLNLPETDGLKNHLQIPETKQTGRGKRASGAYYGLVFIVLIVLAGLSGFVYWKISNESAGDKKSPAATNSTTPGSSEKKSGPERQLRYHLIVQKMRNGKPFEEPFKSSGQEIFENGYKFKMVFSSDADGFLYLFNEDKDDSGDVVYHILYPLPSLNKGSGSISPNQEIETRQNEFGGKRGTEKIWLVWSAEKLDYLETTKQTAFETQGTLKVPEEVAKFSKFLTDHYDPTLKASKNKETQETVVTGKTDTVVHLIELEHR